MLMNMHRPQSVCQLLHMRLATSLSTGSVVCSQDENASVLAQKKKQGCCEVAHPLCGTLSRRGLQPN